MVLVPLIGHVLLPSPKTESFLIWFICIMPELLPVWEKLVLTARLLILLQLKCKNAGIVGQYAEKCRHILLLVLAHDDELIID